MGRDNEINFWLLVALMSLVIAIHFRPYPKAIWDCSDGYRRSTIDPHADGNQPSSGAKCRRYCKILFACCFLSLIVAIFFGFFAYGFPALLLLSGGEYCAGRGFGTPTTTCRSEEDAGSDPFLFVFFPTFLMWVFDTVGNAMVGRLPYWNNNEFGAFCRVLSSVMLPRFGLTLIYCSLILYAENIQVHIMLDDEEILDDDGQLMDEAIIKKFENYAWLLTRAGHISISLGFSLLLLGSGLSFWSASRHDHVDHDRVEMEGSWTVNQTQQNRHEPGPRSRN